MGRKDLRKLKHELITLIRIQVECSGYTFGLGKLICLTSSLKASQKKTKTQVHHLSQEPPRMLRIQIWSYEASTSNSKPEG